jgi:hypothetical protein
MYTWDIIHALFPTTFILVRSIEMGEQYEIENFHK